MTGRLVVDCSYGRWERTLAKTCVSIELNGHQTLAAWGQWVVDVPPGNHHVRVVTLRGKRGLGPAELDVAVPPGQVTTVYYRPPGLKGARGAIGLTPQETPSSGWWVIGFILLLMFVLFVVQMGVLLTR